MTFQEIILNLQKFWAEQGCILQQPYDMEKGAGTIDRRLFYTLSDLNLGPFAMWNHPVVRRMAVMVTIQTVCSNIINSRLSLNHSPENIQELYLKKLGNFGDSCERP